MSGFSQVTVLPASIDTVLGRKQFGSHPSNDEPGAFFTVVCVLDDCDTVPDSGVTWLTLSKLPFGASTTNVTSTVSPVATPVMLIESPLKYDDLPSCNVRVLSSPAIDCVTITLNETEPWLPDASFAMHVTVVLPIENSEPEYGVQLGPYVTAVLSVCCRKIIGYYGTV